MNNRKAQASLVMIVLIIIIFIGVGLFLLISSLTTEGTEYYNLYTHDLLVSVMRVKTGYKNPCETVSDTLYCAMTRVERQCKYSMDETIKKDCREVADEVTPEVIRKVLTTKPSLDYYMIIQPEDPEHLGGEIITYGNPDVQNRGKTWTANERVLRYQTNLQIQLILTSI
ncbi:MAG: hypothetical protein GTN38_00865 [Candidatus Aenigmarchaeota archaeon]|nr:hypothetical protein [Candidatus Aenigmarchaeota archaeon]NIP40138.1 hypothetical protein [Candidatus Aenigmarchaeota archaeon]NIQ18215.1 hypothetical protein [Candidatus Aenigmarchaeota archaeon]NIS72972.1 hypothetical protein [Candidatus Aenigmarchaeota archaeon]